MITLLALTGLCMLLLLAQAGIAAAADQDQNNCNTGVSSNCDEYNNQHGGSSIGNQYGTPLQNPTGALQLGPVLTSLFPGGTPVVCGDVDGGKCGGFTSYNAGPVVESGTRGTSQACDDCHKNVVGRPHHGSVPQSDTDCYVCHSKHLVCAFCHDLGKGGNSATNALNKPLNNFGTGIQLPPVIDEALNDVPIIDVHRAIQHAGFEVMYAPLDESGVADVVRAAMGDDPCWACQGMMSATDEAVSDQYMWKTNQPPLASGGQLEAGKTINPLIPTSVPSLPNISGTSSSDTGKQLPGLPITTLPVPIQLSGSSGLPNPGQVGGEVSSLVSGSH